MAICSGGILKLCRVFVSETVCASLRVFIYKAAMDGGGILGQLAAACYSIRASDEESQQTLGPQLRRFRVSLRGCSPSDNTQCCGCALIRPSY